MDAIYFLSRADFGFCDYDITQTDSGSYTWEEMEGNMEVSQTCALGAAMEVSMQEAVARRMCNVFGEWEDPNVENCLSIVSRQFQDLNTVSTTIMTVITGGNVICNQLGIFTPLLRNRINGEISEHFIN